MDLISGTEIIKIRDKMPLEELKRITEETKTRCGYISYREIFITMGYTPVYSNMYYKPLNHSNQ